MYIEFGEIHYSLIDDVIVNKLFILNFDDNKHHINVILV